MGRTARRTRGAQAGDAQQGGAAQEPRGAGQRAHDTVLCRRETLVGLRDRDPVTLEQVLPAIRVLARSAVARYGADDPDDPDDVAEETMLAVLSHLEPGQPGAFDPG